MTWLFNKSNPPITAIELADLRSCRQKVEVAFVVLITEDMLIVPVAFDIVAFDIWRDLEGGMSVGPTTIRYIEAQPEAKIQSESFSHHIRSIYRFPFFLLWRHYHRTLHGWCAWPLE